MNFINFARDILHQPYFASFLAVAVCICFYILKAENKNFRKIVWIAYSLLFILTIAILIGNILIRLSHPQIWDFTAFYLYGKVADAGYDYYLPENFHLVYNTLTLPPLPYREFVEEVVNAGFLYPPPTILLFAPLGFLSYNTALITWTIFNLFFAIGCIYLAYDLFFKKYKLNGLMLVTMLFFLLSPVRQTISFSQTNFILFFLLLLMYKYSDRKFAGILLALAVFTKPYVIVFGLFFLLRKQWKTISYFIISSLVLVGITALLFGVKPFISYIFNNPSKRLPAWVFSEDINQSLHAVLLRLNFIEFDKPLIYTIISAGVFLVTAFYLFYLLKKKLYDYIWAILLLVALLIYPGTLSYYGVLLLFIIFQIFDEKSPLGFNRYISVPIIFIFYYLSAISLFACIWFLIVITIAKSISLVNKTSFIQERS